MKRGINSFGGEGSPDNLGTYNIAYDGTPQYVYHRNWLGIGTWIQQPDSLFTSAFYENTARTAYAYRNASDIIGVNTYKVFREYPETAGETDPLSS